MNTFEYLWLLGVIFLAAKLLLMIIALVHVDQYLRRQANSIETNPSHHDVATVHILIPLLREQAILPSLMQRFSQLLSQFPELSLTLITTERESRENMTQGTSKQTTAELLEEILAQPDYETARIAHLHFPQFNQVVAEQLNFAIEHLATLPSTRQRFVAIYNADSIIDESTIISLVARARSAIPVSQQSALFLWNLPRILSLNRYYSAIHALYQSCWTLQHEVPRYMLNKHFLKTIPTFVEECGLVHCVTHGLLIRLDVLTSIKGFPVLPLGGEDLALGFALKVSGFHVFPIPRLENAETPETVGSLWKQLAGWYLGSLGYLVFWRSIPIDLLRQHLGRVIIISLLGILDSLTWLLKGPIIIAFFLISLFTDHVLVASVLYLMYFYIPLFYLLWFWYGLPEAMFPRPSRGKLAIAASLYWLVPVLRSGPPWLGVLWAARVALGQHFIKPKTERL